MKSTNSEKLIMLEEFIIQSQNKFPGATGELSQLLRDIGLAAKIISREVNKAGITNLLGLDGSKNVHGESVKKLDLLADDQRIMEINPKSIHQRTPIYIGSPENVRNVQAFLEEYRKASGDNLS